ncbi:hypothetical protein RRG08_014867 [Elysia crispata]|uniref:Uncharacterized protein n=1 Tax=Elysia crispata TaxID=231223 RepID=A0AAE1AMH8_9GAST|nr:hypothetical protein RRG08_014867 [Elysia crispata]
MDPSQLSSDLKFGWVYSKMSEALSPHSLEKTDHTWSSTLGSSSFRRRKLGSVVNVLRFVIQWFRIKSRLKLQLTRLDLVDTGRFSPGTSGHLVDNLFMSLTGRFSPGINGHLVVSQEVT